MKIKVFLAMYALILAAQVLISSASQAATFRSGKSTIIQSGRTINDDVYVAGNNVRVDGTINGDLVAAGGTIRVRGRVNGDLIAIGGQIFIEGDVAETARVAGGNITIEGDIEKDLLIAGGDINLSHGSRVGRDLVAGAGTLDFAGMVSRRFYGGINKLDLNGQVGRSVRLEVDELKLGPQAQIGGDLRYKAPKEAEISQDAKIAGDIKHTKAKRKEPQRKAAAIAGKAIFGLAWLLILGVVLFLLFPRFGFLTTAVLDREPLKSAGWGLLLLIAAPFAILILFITVLGIPVALILLLLYFLAIYLSKIYVGHYIGAKILNALLSKPPHWFWALLTGLFVIVLLGLIPFLGFLVRFAVILLGMGALALVTARYISTNRATTS